MQKMPTWKGLAVLLTAVIGCQAALAQQEPDAVTNQEPAPLPQYCTTEEHRQFDFWLGEWNVTSNGQVAGSNRVVQVLNGCAVQENWQGASGISGNSYNLFDRATGKWHQTWVDSSGTLLQLDGGLVDGVMVLEGKRPTADGSGVALHRIRWTQNDDGTVQQLWEASQDQGASWTVVFDGLYSKADDHQD